MINKSKLMLIGTVTALLASSASLGLAQTATTTGRGPQSINHSGYSAYARITDYSAVVPPSVGRPNPFGVNGWFNR
jgi:hypothetical protein